MKVLFLATPKFSIKFLETLIKNHHVPLIITQPDKPKGRGQKIERSILKQYGLDKKIEVLTPQNPDEIIEKVEKISPDIAVAVAYGKKLSRRFFSIPKHKTLNIHFSLLPKYRGAAPIQWSLINGETKTGITIFEIDENLDTGLIYNQISVNITLKDNACSLREKLVDVGVEKLIQTLSDIEKGIALKNKQQGVASYARILTKKDAILDFDKTATEIHNKVRGLSMGPYPYTFFTNNNKKSRLQILETAVYEKNLGNENFECGQIVCVEKDLGFLVKCHNSLLLIKNVRPEAKKAMSAIDFINGFKLKSGDFISSD